MFFAVVAVGLLAFLLTRGSRSHQVTLPACRPGRGLDTRPGPRQLAVNADGRDRAIYLVDVDKGPVRELVPEGWFRTWSPDGLQFVYRAGHDLELHVADVDGSRDRVIASGGLGAAAWCPGGGQIAHDADGAGIEILDLATGRARRISKAPDFVDDLSWSPDGRWIAVSTGFDGIWLVRSDGSEMRQLAKGGYDFSPSWSPDSRLVAYTHSDKPGFKPRSIIVVRPDGSGYRRVTNGFNDDGPTWSPDGASIAFHRQVIQYRGEPPEARWNHIELIDLATGTVRPVETASGRGRFPAWRPLPTR